MSDPDITFMRAALVEARKGLGRTSPNPCVGAVVVREGRIVGRGYHQRAGTPHAEVHALADAGPLAAGATVYVTLEPCNHTGRTPPCTEALLKAGVSRVVVGMADPNPQVRGGGSQYLREHGVDVTEAVCQAECQAINRPFVKHSRSGVPWVILKAGLSLDGRISYCAGQGGQITGEQSRRFVHRLRDRCDAILIGIGTALIDDPSLTTRLPSGQGRDPLRVLLDSRLRCSPQARMFTQDSAAATWIFHGPGVNEESRRPLLKAGARLLETACDEAGRLDLRTVLVTLGQEGITTVLVEGGATIHASLLHGRLADEAMLFYAPVFIGDQGTPLVSGHPVPLAQSSPRLSTLTTRCLGDDILLRGLLS
ncbi:MAG: riboflavin biosynthesis protein RibD [Desulfobulbaceae bacterium A2]|nr:MAG: riboflavin biosynthesis protein RibD [Desulfobulbaceae bacterium A2]